MFRLAILATAVVHAAAASSGNGDLDIFTPTYTSVGTGTCCRTGPKSKGFGTYTLESFGALADGADEATAALTCFAGCSSSDGCIATEVIYKYHKGALVGFQCEYHTETVTGSAAGRNCKTHECFQSDGAGAAPEPTLEPTVAPTADPTPEPSQGPTLEPTLEPTASPTLTPPPPPPFTSFVFTQASGCCRDAQGGPGTFTKLLNSDATTCESTCLGDATCVAFEVKVNQFKNRKGEIKVSSITCEIHSEAITSTRNGRLCKSTTCSLKTGVPLDTGSIASTDANGDPTTATAVSVTVTSADGSVAQRGEICGEGQAALDSLKAQLFNFVLNSVDTELAVLSVTTNCDADAANALSRRGRRNDPFKLNVILDAPFSARGTDQDVTADADSVAAQLSTAGAVALTLTKSDGSTVQLDNSNAGVVEANRAEVAPFGPTPQPTAAPTAAPTTAAPTASPTTAKPSAAPSAAPSASPTTAQPSVAPSAAPTIYVSTSTPAPVVGGDVSAVESATGEGDSSGAEAGANGAVVGLSVALVVVVALVGVAVVALRKSGALQQDADELAAPESELRVSQI